MEVVENRVLAFGAHPDDVEFMCAGTLVLLKQLGFEIHVATMTQGDGGSMDLPGPEIARVRRAEAEEACRLLGATYHYAGYYDFGIFNDDSTNRRVTAIMREVNPFIVFTHPPADYMSDHEITSRLVRNACFYGPVPNYDTTRFTTSGRSSRIPYLYYAQPMEGIDIFGDKIPPHFYVDVTQAIGEKESMLACHESQRSWLREHHGMDEYVESMRRWSRQLAGEASPIAGRPIEWAEAFKQHRGHSYPSANVLADLLGDRVVECPQ